MTHTEYKQNGGAPYGIIAQAKFTGDGTSALIARQTVYGAQVGGRNGTYAKKLTPAQARRARKKFNRARYEAERLSLKAERRIIKAEEQRRKASVWQRFEQMLRLTKPKTKAQVEAEVEAENKRLADANEAAVQDYL